MTEPPDTIAAPSEDMSAEPTAAAVAPPVGPAYPAPLMPPPARTPGTNRLAVWALVTGILGVVPPLGIVAIVLGARALNQVMERNQAGRRLAITGIVLGCVAVVVWLGVAALSIMNTEAPRDASGNVTQRSSMFVSDLAAGDCFDSGTAEEVDWVTVLPCAQPHDSQVIAVFELPEGPYPGVDALAEDADAGCQQRGAPLVSEDRLEEIEPSYIYPADEDTWDTDRTIQCTVGSVDGEQLTGSVLASTNTRTT
ncbi:DUF4190 domain-containing protein [Terracoccus luteus]|uniref:Regulator of septum formation n=1 Tax=Terracoccus luteus TaxID=53356 RepID=A0A839PW45_9MICO|nr:DUF4190 domain-containing protein [Terracoccus luteus]MBB2988310.1 hypothetical protein [Terracoccus luteus]MCP2173945.1 hypothetical protein [Terracoccus luteus]